MCIRLVIFYNIRLHHSLSKILCLMCVYICITRSSTRIASLSHSFCCFFFILFHNSDKIFRFHSSAPESESKASCWKMEIESQRNNKNDPSRIKIFFREHFLVPVFVVLTILMLILVQIRYVFIICGGLAFLFFVSILFCCESTSLQ